MINICGVWEYKIHFTLYCLYKLYKCDCDEYSDVEKLIQMFQGIYSDVDSMYNIMKKYFVSFLTF